MIIAHNDFDGFCSAGILILAEADNLEELNYATVGYINKFLKKLSLNEKPEKIYLVDINADDSELYIKRLHELNAKGFEIIIYDHHNFPYDDQLKAVGIKVIRNTEMCCSQVVYEIFIDKIEESKKYKADFLLCVGAIDDKKITPYVEKRMMKMRTESLFDVYACLMAGLKNGRQFLSNLFYERDKDGVGFTKKLFENATNRRFFLEKIKKQTLKDQEIIRNIRIIHIFTSYIGIASGYLIEQPGTDYVIAIGDGRADLNIRIKDIIKNLFLKNLFRRHLQIYRNIRISIRTKKPVSEIVSRLAKKYNGEGGGHSMACGANIPIENVNNFIRDIIYQFLKMS